MQESERSLVVKMKDNIDLTENRIFRSKSDRAQTDVEYDILLATINGKFPWSRKPPKIIESDDDLGFDEEIRFQPIPLGNRADRERFREISHAISVQYCDRCGTQVNIFPWDMQECLCKRCKRDLEKVYGTKNTLFGRYEEVIPNSNIIEWV